MTVVRASDLVLSSRDIARAAAYFGISEVELLVGFENAVFRATAPVGRILRITHTSRRSAEMVGAEFAFMRHLANADVPVAVPVPSTGHRTVERLVSESGEPLVVACMTEAAGRRRPLAEWSDLDIEAYGALLGRMHVAAKSYEPPPGSCLRPPWTAPCFDVREGCTLDDRALFDRGQALREVAMSHPAGGVELLIHRDAHPGNVLITDAGEITVFDFDDCCYGTATHDLAIVLFYWLASQDRAPATEARRFLESFLRGYECHARLPSNWPSGVDVFLSYREFELHWLISLDPIDQRSDRDRWFIDRRKRLLEGVPFLDAPLGEVL